MCEVCFCLFACFAFLTLGQDSVVEMIFYYGKRQLIIELMI